MDFLRKLIAGGNSTPRPRTSPRQETPRQNYLWNFTPEDKRHYRETLAPQRFRELQAATDPVSLHNAGFVLFMGKEDTSGIPSIKAAACLEPTHEEHPLAIGFILSQSGETQQAIQYLNQGIQLNPDRADGYSLKATCYERLQQWDAAIAELDTAINLTPNPEWKANFLTKQSNCHVRSGRPQRAAECLCKALIAKPRYANAIHSLMLLGGLGLDAVWICGDNGTLLAFIELADDVNAGIIGEHTILHYACGFDRDYELIADILSRGANPNAVNHNGNTPLHLTAQRGSNHNVARLLINAGARLDICNDKGQTPLETAYANGNNIIAGTLTPPPNKELSAKIKQLNYKRYRYLDAIYWRQGLWSREVGMEAYLPPLSMNDSIWLGTVSSHPCTDNIIMAFETTRTHPFEDCAIADKDEIRRLFSSPLQEDNLKGQMMLTAAVIGNPDAIVDRDALLGRPYWELTRVPIDDSIKRAVSISSGRAAGDIIKEASDIMLHLNIRPYNYWTSETELMIAAGRPKNPSEPQNRQEFEKRIPLLVSRPGWSPEMAQTNLREWSNNQRCSNEPYYNWEKIQKADESLAAAMKDLPALRDLLESEGHCDDDAELILRLVRLGRFGYGNQLISRRYRAG